MSYQRTEDRGRRTETLSQQGYFPPLKKGGEGGGEFCTETKSPSVPLLQRGKWSELAMDCPG